tara:strand:- start:89 stop:286 length:198 start_codon:yes stop_codon:yes gene_type:complete
MVIEFLLLLIILLWITFIFHMKNKIVNAGEGKTKIVKVYPGTQIPMEPEHESSFANTAMWLEMYD